MPREENTKKSRKKRICKILSGSFLLLTLAVSLLPATLLPPPLALLDDLLLRLFAATAILSLLFGEEMLRLRPRLRPKTAFTRGACVLSLLVALNNFPFFDLLSGRAQPSLSPLPLVLYLLLSLATAAFEESLFRGLLLPLFLERAKPTRRSLLGAVVLSSAVFAALHLVNLVTAPLPATLLQVAYTFGIGLLASVLFLLTDSLLLPFLFHALYNFGGLFLPTFASQPAPTLGTVLFTTALSVAAGVASLFAFFDYARENL